MNKIPNLPNYIFAFGALLWTLTYLGQPYLNLPRTLYLILVISGVLLQIFGVIFILKKKNS